MFAIQSLAHADPLPVRPAPARAKVQARLVHKEHDLRWMLVPMQSQAAPESSDPLAFLSNDAGTVRWTPTKTGRFIGVAAIFKF